MPVLMFQAKFWEAVSNGTKRQTIRPRGERGQRIKIGDTLMLRRWAGAPYRSKQIGLRWDETCKDVRGVVIWFDGMLVEGGDDQFASPEEFAKADGFRSFQELADWFDLTHGLPFHGDLIRW